VLNLLISLFCLLPVFATVIHVPADLPGIQQAMDATAPGDTVLVAPGTWPCLLVSPTHGMTLASHYMMSGDSTHINETILDGEDQGTILTLVTEGEDEVFFLQGFTMMRGLGQQLSTHPNCDRAGAIHIEEFANAVITDMVFTQNHAPRTGCVLLQFVECSPQPVEGDLTLKRVHVFGNTLDQTGVFHNCIYLQGGPSNLTIDGFQYNGLGSAVNVIDLSGTTWNSINIQNVNIWDCDGAILDLNCRTDSSDTQLFSNIRSRSSEDNSGCSIYLRTNYSPSPATTRLSNIDVSGMRGARGLFLDSQTAFLEIDSLYLHHNRNNSEQNNAVASIASDVGGTIRNLHFHDNVSGDSLSGVPKSMLRLEGVDLVDSYIHDNRVIIPPHPDPSAYPGGHWVQGPLIYMLSSQGPPTPILVENVLFENNRVEDLDDYSDLTPESAYKENTGRELWISADDIVSICDVVVRNSRQPNHCPEVVGDLDIADLSDCMKIYSPRKILVDHVMIEDSDDGGLHLGADTLLLENLIIRNVGRRGLQLGGGGDEGSPCYMRLRNVLIENVDAKDEYTYLHGHPEWGRQGAISIYARSTGPDSINPVIDFENVTITSCDSMRHLLRIDGPIDLHLRNSIFWSNTPELFLQNDEDFGVLDLHWEYNLVQEWVEGEGNLIGVDPLFDMDMGIPFLSAASPCVDAGDPASIYNDPEDPLNPGFALWPSLGTVRNDMGFTGGPGSSAIDTSWVAIVVEPRVLRPQGFQLEAPFPNPFNPSTQLRFVLPRAVDVELTVYDLLGREVVTLAQGSLIAGTHEVQFHGNGLASGVYLAALVVEGKQMSTQKMLLLK
jgi:hypothetical protein